MNKQNRKLKIIVGIILAIDIVLVSSVIYLYFELQSIKSDLIDIIAEKIQMDNIASNALALESSVKDTTDERNKLDSYFIKKREEVASLLTEIERIGEKLELTINVGVKSGSVSFGEESVSALHLEIQTEGLFETTHQFVNLLELLSYNVNISEFNTKVAGYGENIKWISVIEADVLSYIEE